MTRKKHGYNLGVNVLTPKGIFPGKSYVKGYLLQQTKPKINFVPAILPLPNVIYNRIPYRNDEQSPETVQALTFLQHHKKIPLFNPYFFNKWSLYQDLAPIQSCKPYLPNTRRFADFTTFKQMLLRYPSVFLKPVHGKAGIGMMKIEGRNPFILTYQSKRQKQKIRTTNMQKLYQYIKQLCRNQPYLLQQGIDLSTYENRPYDLRMLVQKDSTANWKVTGVGVRVAGENAISTHVPMGGRIESIDRVLNSSFPNTKERILTQLMKLGPHFAREIEAKRKGFHGEMSMDIGVDKQGKLWFFEANAKPQKFDEPEIRDQSLRRIIEYSLYLSGFQRGSKRVRSS